MVADDMDRRIGAYAAIPDSLRGLVRAIRREAIPAKDPRVKSLWDLLRRRGLLAGSPWLKGVLLRCWQGLPARERPRTTRRLVARLRTIGILPPRPGQIAQGPMVAQGPVVARVRGAWPMRLTRVGTIRPSPMRPVRAVRLQPVARGFRR